MNFRVTTRFTWLDSTIRWGWLRKEKRIWREKRKERRRSGQDTGNKKKISRNLRRNKKTQGWISKQDTQEYQWYHEYFSWETWKRARAWKGRIEATEIRNWESNSTNTKCPIGRTRPTFYATASRFVNDGYAPEVLLTVKPETEL